jgi:hypothetical protein
VVPAAVFPSVVTLRSVSVRELILAIKTLLACKSYGAESRIGGDMRNSVFGIVGGWEEAITPLEFTLELYDKAAGKTQGISGEAVEEIATRYTHLMGNPDRAKVLKPAEVDAVVKEAADTKLNGEFLRAVYEDAALYRNSQGKGKKASKSGNQAKKRRSKEDKGDDTAN